MNYENYQVEDFVNDPDFIRWVRNPNDDTRAFWLTWLEQHPDKRMVVEDARQMVLFLSFNAARPSREETAEVKQNIKAHIRRGSPDKLPTRESQPEAHARVRTWPYYYRFAAAFAGFLLVSTILYYIIQYNTYTILHTGFGETQTIALPDGSLATLNANSTLRFAKRWDSDEHREVYLDGEAFFDVQKQPVAGSLSGRKFTVHTHDVQVEVLGTRFNVNNRRGVVKVILNSGQVKLNSGQGDVWMKPNELVEFTPQNQSFSKKNVEAEKHTAWRHRKLIFDEVPMHEIAQFIEDNYGLQVTFTDPSLATRKFTGAIPYRSVDLFLTVLAESFDLRITKESNSLIMEKR